MHGVGLGAYPGDKCYDPTRASWLPYIIDNPSEWGCVVSNLSADTYQQINYGTLPKPLPPPVAGTPVLNISTGELEPSVLSPGQWGQPTLNEIATMTANGTYGGGTPAGPTALGLSDFMDQYGMYIVLGLGLILVTKVI